jgi:hypothetical protein
VGRMRGAVAPLLNGAIEDEERFSLIQGMLVSAGAMFAGLTVGHMTRPRQNETTRQRPRDQGRYDHLPQRHQTRRARGSRGDA